ncbi:MAG TPA: Xaa-Pro aminopeptidase [Tepidisphaeraceae bacterium]|nr:Xaa-Pro aminopeptidase [Tepidisphaeraceae bacterium]
MNTIRIDPQLFISNRSRLKQRLLPDSLVVVNSNDVMPTNADGTLGFHQNADLFYLTGIDQEETMLVLAPDAYDPNSREILFIRQPSEHLATWEGQKLTRQQAREISGVKNVRWLSEFWEVFHGLMVECQHVYLNSNEHPRAQVVVESRDARFIAECRKRYPLHDYRRLARIMHELRSVKSPREIELIRQACRITRGGFLRALSRIKPGINEADIHAEFAHEFVRSHARFAYPPIIAAGKNNCVLHYTANNQVCRKGQLLLMDVAAAHAYYASDLTRTVPVSGRFTRRQKQVYNAVLRIFRATVAEMKPGVLPRELRKFTEQITEKQLVDLGLITMRELRRQDPENPLLRKYFMHGVAHSLGLDVHDVAIASEPFKPGYVLTCEPGIYLREEGFGIRLENDILITETGNQDLMADIPIEAEEIEELMSAGQRDSSGWIKTS